MKNIIVLKNRLDESTEIVENTLGLKAKKTPWFLRFVGKMKAAAAIVVGIGLLASPFLLKADDEDDEIPKITSIYVTNHGSTGFEIEFRVSSSFPYWIAKGYRSALYEQYWTTTGNPIFVGVELNSLPLGIVGFAPIRLIGTKSLTTTSLLAQNPLIFLLLWIRKLDQLTGASVILVR